MKLEQLIEQHGETLSGNDKMIFFDILSRPHEFAGMSSARMAEECHVSRATLLRLCRKIGLTSLSDLRLLLKQADEGRAKPGSGTEDFGRVCDIYQELVSSLDEIPCRDVCRLLYESKTIYIYGTGNEQKTLADEFKRIFLSAGKCVIDLFDYGEVEFMKERFDGTDTFIVISLSGETKEGLRILDLVRTTKARLLSITRLQNNSMSRLCDYNLYVATKTVDSRIPYELVSVFYVLLDLLFINYLEYVSEVERGL